MMKWVVACAVGLTSLVSNRLQAQSGDLMELHVGSVRVLGIGEVDRVAVGQENVVGATMLEGGQLLLIGRNEGQTEVRVWLKDGLTRQWMLNVLPRNPAVAVSTIASLFADYPDVKVRSVGGVTAVDGRVPSARFEQLNLMLSSIPGAVSLLQRATGSLETLVRNYPGVTYREEDGTVILEGEVHTSQFEAFRTILQGYPNVFSFVQPTTVMPAPLVRVSLRLLEVNRDHSRRIGINWEDAAPGPTVASTGASAATTRFRVVPPSIEDFGITNNIAVDDARWFAYAGWTTAIFSTLEMLQQENNATILAEPNLLTRSGEAARFLAGGEYPIPVIGQFGELNVEFREYGIIMEMTPAVDRRGNIETKLKIEVSSLDQANAINGIPGLLKRETESVFTVRSDETVILSGLISADEVRNMSGVPGLVKVPILGELFKSRDFQTRKTELVILVTPTIVRPPEELGLHLEDTTRRMRRLLDDRVLEGAIVD
jgi:pilus assembly protein CpaC